MHLALSTTRIFPSIFKKGIVLVSLLSKKMFSRATSSCLFLFVPVLVFPLITFYMLSLPFLYIISSSTYTTLPFSLVLLSCFFSYSLLSFLLLFLLLSFFLFLLIMSRHSGLKLDHHPSNKTGRDRCNGEGRGRRGKKESETEGACRR